ncbi:MAG: peptidase [Myxococcales bacterium]|nr:peptidase [Myxococcales bacterium]
MLLYPAMKRRLIFLAIFAGCCPPEAAKQTATVPPPKTETKDLAVAGESHLHNLRQITFGGDNAEAYWAFGGDRLIMQTNHTPYKCDQIEELPLTGGPGKLVSTGKGRTTCSYFLKGDKEIIYASTHDASPECPKPPDMSKGYNWGLFDYDIYRANADGTNLRRLTNTPGYDAEATVCPVDGSIIFTSMRDGDLDLYRMDADGNHVQRLTNTPGYDGGAFFSADCSKIVWRASRPQGKDLDAYNELLQQKLVRPTKMDLWVANADGTEAHQVTYLPGASFGPYFFPSGKRIIFASNYLAPKGPEFDLFAIDIDGTHLERITYAGGFDGFPMFSPDGKTLSFSSNRRDTAKTDKGEVYRATGGSAGEHDTNVFLADWVDVASPSGSGPVTQSPLQPETSTADHYAETVRFLAADEQEGRGIGTQGLTRSAAYVEGILKAVGAEVTRQTFDVTTSVERGVKTAVTIDGKALAADDYVPAAFSSTTKAEASIVDVGWGIVDEATRLDDYKGKQVKGKIALVHRFAPAKADAATAIDSTTAARLGDLRKKAFVARTKGAAGLIVVDDGDLAQEEAPLPTLSIDGIADLVGGGADAGIPVVMIKRSAATGLVKGSHKASLAIALEPKRTPTDNVIGVIHAGAANKQPGVLVIGAHLDHLGMGGGGSALDPKVHAVHNGADDNASGVAALLEVARILGPRKAELQRDVYLVAFSGEEEGDLGSAYFVKNPPVQQPIVAMLNMDMVGRMRGNHLSVNGGESAKEWRELVEPACAAARVSCTIGGSGYGPSDHMAFYVANIPVLFFFTGNHLDYHTATDDAEKINSAGGARVAMIVADVALATANRGAALSYVKAPPEMSGGDVRRQGASLGTVPSYSEDPNQPPGVQLSDVVPEGAAAKAGLKGGDRIIAVGTVEIRNINDLMFVLQAAKPGTDVKVTFVRDGKQQTVNATYGAPRGKR